MKKNRYYQIVLLALVFSFGLTHSVLAGKKGKQHQVSCKSVIFSDSTKVKRFYGKRVHDQILPASTVKVMTALLVLEELPLDEYVTVSKRAMYPQPSKIYAATGEKYKVRDLLYVTDLIEAYDKFIQSDLKHAVFNIGGGLENTISLLEFLSLLEKETGGKAKITFADWRPSDQKVYISDISTVKKELDWQPEISPQEGVKKLIVWIKEKRDLF